MTALFSHPPTGRRRAPTTVSGVTMTVRLPIDHWGTRAISCYEKVEQIGEGTYGQVNAPTMISFFLESSFNLQHSL